MDARLTHCGCGWPAVKFGLNVGAGETPTHGHTVYCPVCGGGMVWDAPSFLTRRMYIFACDDFDGRVLGQPEPADWPRRAPEGAS